MIDRSISEKKPGRKYWARRKDGLLFVALAAKDGTFSVAPEIGGSFRSISKAGAMVTGHATNGYVFWKDYKEPNDEAESLFATLQKAAPKPKARRKKEAT